MPGPFSHVSFWFDSLDEPVVPRPPLPGDLDVDVAVVGAGFTGLWTARYLRRADPALRIAVLEREVAGYGASGRNGGWCSALFAASDSKLERLAGRAAALDMRHAMQATVDEVGRSAAEDGIDCHFTKGGTVVLARSPAQLERLREEVEAARRFGLGEEDIRLLSQSEATAAVGATAVFGGTFTPHCATIHPARLAAAWRRRCARPASTSMSGHRSWPSDPDAASPPTAPCGPGWWCAPRRATPCASRASTAAWRPSIR